MILNSTQPKSSAWRLRGAVLFPVLSLAALPNPCSLAQAGDSPLGPPVSHRYLVAYRDTAIPAGVQARIHSLSDLSAATRIIHLHPAFGIAVIQADPSVDDAAALAELRAQPGVEFAVHDRMVSSHGLAVRAVVPALIGVVAGPARPAYDTYYISAQGWAVRQSGGFGAGIAGGVTQGPWNTTLGAGMRIAILDSGVDANHPDIVPNLALNLSEVDQSAATGVPSSCDDGSPADQQGHGTWTASLAAGALGPGTGQVVGVAPQATLLNIKVLERLPNPANSATDPYSRCRTGQASGLLSWVVQGIQDAVANHADVISLSLGALIDLQSGEGAGIKTIFDRVTHAAFASGAVLVASAGNNGLDLSNPRYVELPAQARDVLAVVASTNPACSENLSVGARCEAGPVTLPYYSNYGANLNAIAAPGGSYPQIVGPEPDNAVSGWVRGACSSGLAQTSDGIPGDSAHSFGCFNLGHAEYVEAIGTSASAPLLAGAVALLRGANPGWTPSHIVSALRLNGVSAPSLPSALVLNPQVLP
ncbi:MAG: hypothetical protein NVSMB62_11010 [Acidobacteriaceae bacterium]